MDAAKQVAQTIAADAVDILVEFNGYWQYRTPDPTPRMEIVALRPAPLQLHMLAFPVSLGGEFIDVGHPPPFRFPAWFTLKYSWTMVVGCCGASSMWGIE